MRAAVHRRWRVQRGRSALRQLHHVPDAPCRRRNVSARLHPRLWRQQRIERHHRHLLWHRSVPVLHRRYWNRTASRVRLITCRCEDRETTCLLHDVTVKDHDISFKWQDLCSTLASISTWTAGRDTWATSSINRCSRIPMTSSWIIEPKPIQLAASSSQVPAWKAVVTRRLVSLFQKKTSPIGHTMTLTRSCSSRSWMDVSSDKAIIFLCAQGRLYSFQTSKFK